jgi:hypothetical protein
MLAHKSGRPSGIIGGHGEGAPNPRIARSAALEGTRGSLTSDAAEVKIGYVTLIVPCIHGWMMQT